MTTSRADGTTVAPRVKICGITRERDAMLACELGAAAIGLVLWPRSPRYVRPAAAREMVDGLPPVVVPVGVFADQPLTEIRELVEAVGLGAVQLHGDEPLETIMGVTRPVIRAVASDREDASLVIAALPEGVVVLLDAHDPVRRGGTGRTVDWGRAADLARHRRVILSGGLTPDNVAQAIAIVRPWGVDVSSGVESRPGVKDPERLAAFFAAVRQSAGQEPGAGAAAVRPDSQDPA
jgi:phosphoribosylanthranilate isomerase